jgi:archaeal preflagellin peptidase FlaK
METDWIFFVLFAVMLVVMISASISDWKEREVSDEHWMILGSAGIIGFTIICIIEDELRWEYICLAIGSFMILIDLFVDSDKLLVPFYFTMAILFILPLYNMYGLGNPYLVAWVSVPLSYMIFAGMYIFGILQGGADTKCLICLAMLFPIYPSMFFLPVISVPGNLLSDIFTFAISSLFIGAFLVVLLCVYYLVLNSMRGDKGKGMAIGYMMDIREARSSHVWPMYDFENGELAKCDVPDDPKDIYDRLENAGHTRIWVTPMVPFMIPLTLVAIILVLVGNPLFLVSV